MARSLRRLGHFAEELVGNPARSCHLMSWTTRKWGVKRCMKHVATCLLALAGSDHHVSLAEGSGNALSFDCDARSVALIGQIGNPWPASLREAPSANQRFKGRRNRTVRVEDRGLHRRRNGEGEPCLSVSNLFPPTAPSDAVESSYCLA